MSDTQSVDGSHSKQDDERARTPAYVGFKKCGCAVAAIVDDGKLDVSKDIAKWIRGGLTIERKTVGWVWQNLHFCDCDKK